MGGDEFAILLPTESRKGAERVAEKIMEEISKPFVIDDHHVVVPESIGVALYPENGTMVETLMQHADVAMYVAKQQRLGIAVYHEERDSTTRGRLVVSAELRSAIDNDELRLHYQPKLDVRTGTVTTVEALVRWQHPDQGLLLPAAFVPIAEENGFMQPLTQWVLRTAIKQCSAWRDEGRDVHVAVNLSGMDLQDTELVSTVAQQIKAFGVDPGSLTVEVTESAVMNMVASGQEVLQRLHAMGVRVAIDDFGVRYSSLAYLTHLPVDELKMDPSFLRDAAGSPRHYSIVQSLVARMHLMAHTLPLEQFRQIACDSRCEYKHKVNQLWSHTIVSSPTRVGRYTMPDTRPSDKGKDNADWWRELPGDHRA